MDDEVDALSTPCFSACPSGGALRAEHQQCPDVSTSLFLDALSTPCFAACPSGGALRAEHRQCPDVADTSLFLEQLTDEQRELVLDKIT